MSMTEHLPPAAKRMIYDQPTCAGEWEYLPSFMAVSFFAFGVLVINPTDNPMVFWRRILVTETPGAGRLCKEIRMGGSALCGFAPWSGKWRKAQ